MAPLPGFGPSPSTWRSTLPGFGSATISAPTSTDEAVTVALDGVLATSAWAGADLTRHLTSIEGWWEAPGIRLSSIDRPGGDGALMGTSLLGSRSIAITGAIYTRTRRDLFEDVERVTSILTKAPRHGALVVEEPERELIRQCEVYLAQPPTVSITGLHSARFGWVLRAPDPIRYGVENAVTLTNKGPDQPLTNSGTTPVVLGLELAGPLVNPSFWISGTEWKLTYTIPAGRTVYVRWSDRSVMLGNDDIRYYQTGQWPYLQPGVTAVGFSAVSGTGTCKVLWRSGWL